MNLNLSNLSALVDKYYQENPEAAVSSGYVPPSRPIVAPAPVVTPAPVVPVTPPVPEPSIFTDTTASNTLQDYRDTLGEGADYAAINDVDKVDDFYDNAFMSSFEATPGFSDLDVGGGEFGIASGGIAPARRRNLTAGEYYGAVPDAPEYLSTFLNKEPDPNNTIAAFNSIATIPSSEMASVLSDYYGYDVAPTTQNISTSKFGGNLGEHFKGSKEQLQEFHSLVEPILQEQVPYIQATQGLEYQDALAAAYNNDPMLQALYAKYNVAPVRQTKDGSTYLYDPFSFSEIRTTEVKDPTALDIGKDIIQAVVTTAILGPILGPISSQIGAGLSGLTGGLVPANTISVATNAALQGQDPLQAVGLQVGGDLLSSIRVGTDTVTDMDIGNVNPADNRISVVATPVTVADIIGENTLSNLAGAYTGGGGVGIGETPGFNPYINALTAGASTAQQEETPAVTTIDLAALARAAQQEEAPVTTVTQPEFDDITVDTTVESGELPELEEDIAPPSPPPPPPSTSDGGGGGEEEAGLDIIAAQLREAIAKEEDPDVKAGLSLELEKWMSSGPTEYERMATGPKPSDYEGDNEEEQALLWIGALTNSYGTGTGNDITGDSGSGSGTGSGTGAGAGGGLGDGMLGGAAAGGKSSVTDLVFSDYVKRYKAPELQKRALPLQGYQAPQGLFRGLV